MMRDNQGEKVVCILNSNANLTIGKEYKIIETWVFNENGVWQVMTEKTSTKIENYWYLIENDKGQRVGYNHFRFIPLFEYRSIIIESIVKESDFPENVSKISINDFYTKFSNIVKLVVNQHLDYQIAKQKVLDLKKLAKQSSLKVNIHNEILNKDFWLNLCEEEFQ